MVRELATESSQGPAGAGLVHPSRVNISGQVLLAIRLGQSDYDIAVTVGHASTSMQGSCLRLLHIGNVSLCIDNLHPLWYPCTFPVSHRLFHV